MRLCTPSNTHRSWKGRGKLQSPRTLQAPPALGLRWSLRRCPAAAGCAPASSNEKVVPKSQSRLRLSLGLAEGKAGSSSGRSAQWTCPHGLCSTEYPSNSGGALAFGVRCIGHSCTVPLCFTVKTSVLPQSLTLEHRFHLLDLINSDCQCMSCCRMQEVWASAL